MCRSQGRISVPGYRIWCIGQDVANNIQTKSATAVRLPGAGAVLVGDILPDALAPSVPGVRSVGAIDLMSVYRVADLFCGAGGFSAGAERAVRQLGGTMELVAVNHWPVAIATHSANHPVGRHILADLSAADPYALAPAGLDLLLASPECRYYSRANGGRTTQDQGRMNPWIVHDWISKLDVPAVIVENVAEFTRWGPLDGYGRPDKARAGQYFQAWFLTFGNLGYQAEWRMLNAADYGDATSRTRCFVVARRDGPIRWPEPTHGGDATDLWARPPWRPAADIIDWSNRGRSILGDGRPLRPNTLRRIAHGIRNYNAELAPLFMSLLAGGGGGGGGGMTAPVMPFIVQYYGTSKSHPVSWPLSTVTTVKKHGLAIPEPETPDLRYRMLTNDELAQAMGFTDDEREYQFAGTPDEVTRQIGNAVPVGLAAALVGAVLGG